MNQIAKRNILIDNCKGILIFLVVLGHMLELLKHQSGSFQFVYIFIYQFHMPVFIFLSGYVSKNLEKGRKNAVKNFLVPFIFLNLFWALFRLLGIMFSQYTGTPVIGEARYSLLTPGWTLWYVLALFAWKMLLPDLVRVKKVIFFSLLIGVAAGLFVELTDFASLSRIVKFTPFFLAGYFSNDMTINRIQKKSNLYSYGIILLTIVTTVLFVKFNLPSELLWWDRSYIASGISNMYLGVILASCGYIIGFLWIIVFLNLSPKTNTFLSKIGKNTLSIYFLHTYLVAVGFIITKFIYNDNLKLVTAFLISVLITITLGTTSVHSFVSQLFTKLNNKIFLKE